MSLTDLNRSDKPHLHRRRLKWKDQLNTCQPTLGNSIRKRTYHFKKGNKDKQPN